MLFNTFEFWIFFFFVLLAVHSTPHRVQNRILLLASYLFYAAWDWRFLSLLLVSTIVDFLVALWAAPGRPTRIRKRAVAISVIINLGLLGVFKYYDFFIGSLLALLGASPGVSEQLLLSAALPVGISFYTFQSIGYTCDVYAGRLKPIRSFPDFALYVSFFPQLVAGPIERAARLIPQVVSTRKVTSQMLKSGAYLMAWGLFKKVYIADTLAHPVNVVFASDSPTGPEVYIATMAFAFQIYCDFSGYSDIARGLARWLGFELMLNFNLPYLARNPSEFWRRWHISLSTWLRDYLYIPLGGSRRGTRRTYRNLLITMVLGGLWHGARLNFLLWGAFHGLALAIHRMMIRGRGVESYSSSPWVNCGKIVGMWHLTLLGWLLFRVESMAQLRRLVSALLSSWQSWESAMVMIASMLPVVLPLIVVQAWQFRAREIEVFSRLHWLLGAGVIGILLSSVLLLNRGGATPFIYFQF